MKYMISIIILSIAFFTVSCTNDKKIDEDISIYDICNHGDKFICHGINTGACEPGIKTCYGSEWSDCVGRVEAVEEVCDGIDNDCDGEVDEGTLNSCGECGPTPIELCDRPTYIDNDCDGLSDEYEFRHIVEICDGIDNNCDGNIDEGYSGDNFGAPGKRFECEESLFHDETIVFKDEFDKSICERGWRVCAAGDWTICDGFIPPQPEICDGLDNDCDGQVDEDEDVNGTRCGFDEGACLPGFEVCSEGEIYCVGATQPYPETCDRIDNDCDGEVDEDLNQICETQCGFGVQVCEYGDWSLCNAPIPQPEICDGLDNDCDGEIDEGVLENCNCSDGELRLCKQQNCGHGQQICQNNMWSRCDGQFDLEEVCDNHDNDCDGTIDVGLTRECFDGDPSKLDTGQCRSGNQECHAGIWGLCTGQVLPTIEVCDDVDNNCDGESDNLETYYEKADIIFVIDISLSMDVYVDGLRSALSEIVAYMQYPDHQVALVEFGSQENRGEPHLICNLNRPESIDDCFNNLDFYGSIEPSLDAISMILDNANPLGINWRLDATPIIVLVGDEIMQTNSPDVSAMAGIISRELEVCNLPGCSSVTNQFWIDGKPVEIYIFTHITFLEFWYDILPVDRQRVFDIYRLASETSSIIELQSVLRNLCLE